MTGLAARSLAIVAAVPALMLTGLAADLARWARARLKPTPPTSGHAGTPTREAAP